MYSNKKVFFFAIILFVCVLFTGRLISLQLMSDKYFIESVKNASNEITLYAERSIIYDRNGKLMVFNDVVYDLAVIQKKISKDLDTAALLKILKIDKKTFLNKLNKIRNPSITYTLIKDLTPDIYIPLQENILSYKGFFIEQKTDRRYKSDIGCHILGYIGEVNDKIISKDPYYKQGDYAGITGIENTYETYFRGQKGVKIVIVDHKQIQRGSFKSGSLDSASIPGPSVHTSLHYDVQEMAEEMLKNKIGSIVAIEPSTGEIIAMANSPSFDLNEMIGSSRNQKFASLLKDPYNPLFNRAIKARYPPGSTFKTIQALIGLEQGIVTANTTYPCRGGYHVGSLHVGCHAHPSPLDLPNSIAKSCNAWYCYLFRDMIDDSAYASVADGYSAWREYLLSFGLGIKTGVDLPNEGNGFIPDTGYFNRYYGKDKWKSSMILSLSIGQGEIGVTPLQMANFAACIANRGYWITPHSISAIDGYKKIPAQYLEKHQVPIKRSHFETVIEGMHSVVAPGGTARGAAIKDLDVCGKTGTSQNPHGKDHSIFIGFAPKDNPKIAVAVIIENGGFGATYAAPMATVLMERFLAKTDSVFVSKNPVLYERMRTAKLKNFSQDTLR